MLGLIIRILKQKSRKGKPDISLLNKLGEHGLDYYFNDSYLEVRKLEKGTNLKYLNFSKITDFIEELVSNFGLVTDEMVEEHGQNKKGERIICYSSPELLVYGNEYTKDVEFVSYCGKNRSILDSVEEYMKSQKGYSFCRNDLGFNIIKV